MSIKKPDLSENQEHILSVIEFKSLYGLEIADSIKKATEGKVVIPVGSLYPILKRLEAKGFIKSEWGETTEVREGARRRYYSLTGTGSSVLSETRALRNAVGRYSRQLGGI